MFLDATGRGVATRRHDATSRGPRCYDGWNDASAMAIIMMVRAYCLGRYYYDGTGVSSGEVLL